MLKNRGFTLLELMIVVFVIGFIAVVILMLTGASCGEWRGTGEHAEGAARTHAKKLDWKVKGIACAGVDTDGDGYISCTLVLEDGSERSLECASGGMGIASGCKTAPLIKQNVTNLSGSNSLFEQDDF